MSTTAQDNIWQLETDDFRRTFDSWQDAFAAASACPVPTRLYSPSQALIARTPDVDQPAEDRLATLNYLISAIAGDSACFVWQLRYTGSGAGILYSTADNTIRLAELRRNVKAVLRSSHPTRRLVLTLFHKRHWDLIPLWQITASADDTHPYFQQLISKAEAAPG